MHNKLCKTWDNEVRILVWLLWIAKENICFNIYPKICRRTNIVVNNENLSWSCKILRYMHTLNYTLYIKRDNADIIILIVMFHKSFSVIKQKINKNCVSRNLATSIYYTVAICNGE